MKDPAFKELSDLWQDPVEGEREAFEAMARRARRRGRLLGYVDLGFFLLLAAGVLLSLFMTPNRITVATAILLLAATVWLTWTRRRLRQMAATLVTNDPAAFLDSSVANARANLRRVNLSLVLMLPFVAMAIVFKGSQRSEGGIDRLLQGIVDWVASPRALIGLTIVLLFVLSLLRSRRRLRAELGRLESLRLEYEEERRRDEAGE